MIQETDNDTAAPAAEVPPEAAPAEASPVAATEPKKTKKAKPAPKAKAKAKAKAPSDAEFHAQLVELVYLARKDTNFWVDARSKSKAIEGINQLLKTKPLYKWNMLGESYFLVAAHSPQEETVAYCLPHDPGAEYRRLLREYDAAMKRPRKPKGLLPPAKPASMKRQWRWALVDRRGREDKEGMAPSLVEAQNAVLARKASFTV